ncbi:helix-turn-helix domain-containing protein [Halocatena marina]|uniref:helix-turn-helix domain-containing protein n=1 Tax=Halocatena marina TaxID=2934937 RepID=UPI00200D4A46|nr:helix-turn-helix domain-containing protein [Halocatena marina]
MPQLHLKLDGTAVESCLGPLSTEFPDVEFRLLATQPRNDELLTILEVTTSEGEALVRQLADVPDVHSYEVIHIDEQRVIIQFKSAISSSYNPLIASENIEQPPTIVHDGWFFVKVTASQERLSKLIEELAAGDVPYQVISLTHSYNSSDLLTERQWEAITEAVERGFYETPRGCTLDELAESLNIYKSSANRLLHRAESRIIREFVAEVPP